ncbi:hypothetical protein F4678DRAFT_271884 [Xylaria arbuscula]|nr:hypothetical protein F4678DRAFT_271884 [Xylaria arbuscula]
MGSHNVKKADATLEKSWLKSFTIWKFQLLAASTSLIGFSLLVLLLLTFSGRPLSAWPLQIISINGCIAGLTTLIKGSLLILIVDSISQSKWTWFSAERSLGDLEFIDDASRGPWGSLVWLFKHPFRPGLVHFSAILIILATGLEVVSQQLITIESRNAVDGNQKAHIPWASSTSPRVDPYAWLSAFEEGIFSDTINDLAVTCPSSNCTWDTVPSVGVCAECVDTTHLLPETWISCSDIFCNYSLVATNDSASEEEAELAGFVMTNGPRPNSTWEDLAHLSNPDDIRFNISMAMSVPWSTEQPPLIEVYKGFNGNDQWTKFHRIIFSDFSIIEIPISYFPVVFGNPTVNTCSLWFCMQAITTKVVSGQLQQKAISSQNLHYKNISFPLSEDQSQGDYYVGAQVVATFNNIPGFNMQDREFTINQTDTYIDFWLRGERSELTLIHPTTGEPDPHYGVVFLPPLLLDRWNHTKRERSLWADRLAKSLSNKLRQANQPRPDEDIYAGEVWTQDIYIYVAWYWLTYPALMLVASIGVFAINIRSGLRSRHGLAWGNGTLALLLCEVGVTGKINARGSYESSSKLLESVGKIPVRLEGDESGWIFQTADE